MEPIVPFSDFALKRVQSHVSVIATSRSIIGGLVVLSPSIVVSMREKDDVVVDTAGAIQPDEWLGVYRWGDCVGPV